MDGSIAPTLVIKPTLLVKKVEELCVRLATPEVEVGYLKVAPKMTLVVCNSAIVRQKSHCVVFIDEVWVCIDEFFYRTPKGGYCGLVLIEGNSKTIDLVLILHYQEWIVVEITKEFDVWFDSPVILVWFEQLLPVEETRVEAAHVTVWYTASVDDIVLDHVIAGSGGPGLVDRGGLKPMFTRDLTILCFRAGNFCCQLFKVLGEWFLVQEDIIVHELFVESIFHLFHAIKYSGQVAIPCQNDDGGIGFTILRWNSEVVAVFLRNGGFVGWF